MDPCITGLATRVLAYVAVGECNWPYGRCLVAHIVENDTTPVIDLLQHCKRGPMCGAM